MKKTILAVLMILLIAAKGEAPAAAHPKPVAVLKSYYGMSSWYGLHWKGRMTACGVPFDPDKLTVAHPSLPCGTWVRLTNPRTGHSTFAKVMDRGPYEEGREIDVSERVAKRIDLKKWGVEKIKIEVVKLAVDKR